MKVIRTSGVGGKFIGVDFETENEIFRLNRVVCEAIGLLPQIRTTRNVTTRVNRRIINVTNPEEAARIYVKYLKSHPKYDVFANIGVSEALVVSALVRNTNTPLLLNLAVKGNELDGIVLTIPTNKPQIIVLDTKRIYGLLKSDSINRTQLKLRDFEDSKELYRPEGRIVTFLYNSRRTVDGAVIIMKGFRYKFKIKNVKDRKYLESLKGARPDINEMNIGVNLLFA
ncbi:hypothetical protein D3C81_11780 [compost metagenome]